VRCHWSAGVREGATSAGHSGELRGTRLAPPPPPSKGRQKMQRLSGYTAPHPGATDDASWRRISPIQAQTRSACSRDWSLVPRGAHDLAAPALASCWLQHAVAHRRSDMQARQAETRLDTCVWRRVTRSRCVTSWPHPGDNRRQSDDAMQHHVISGCGGKLPSPTRLG